MATVATVLTPESIAQIYKKIKEAEIMSTKMIDNYGKYETSPNNVYTNHHHFSPASIIKKIVSPYYNRHCTQQKNKIFEPYRLMSHLEGLVETKNFSYKAHSRGRNKQPKIKPEKHSDIKGVKVNNNLMISGRASNKL